MTIDSLTAARLLEASYMGFPNQYKPMRPFADLGFDTLCSWHGYAARRKEEEPTGLELQTEGFSLEAPNGDIVLVIPGSKWVLDGRGLKRQDWVRNVTAALVPCNIPGFEGTLVHEGLQDEHERYWNSVYTWLLNNCKGKTIHIVGHSRGGSLAPLLYAQLSSVQPAHFEMGICETFGMLAAGDLALTERWMQLHGAHLRAHVCNRDGVPNLRTLRELEYVHLWDCPIDGNLLVGRARMTWYRQVKLYFGELAWLADSTTPYNNLNIAELTQWRCGDGLTDHLMSAYIEAMEACKIK